MYQQVYRKVSWSVPQSASLIREPAMGTHLFAYPQNAIHDIFPSIHFTSGRPYAGSLQEGPNRLEFYTALSLGTDLYGI